MEYRVGEAVGEYKIVQVLGGGGFATVYAALNLQGETVALKSPRSFIWDDSDVRIRDQNRFQWRREIRLLRAATGDVLPKFIDESHDPSKPWYVMEYIRFPTLESLVLNERRSEPLEDVDLFDCAYGLIRALRILRLLGIHHRDLKPSNISWAKGSLKILDLGSAKSDGEETALYTKSGAFTAPEIYTKHRFSDTSDIFSMGAVLGFVATGTNIFVSSPFTETSTYFDAMTSDAWVANAHRYVMSDPVLRSSAKSLWPFGEEPLGALVQGSPVLGRVSSALAFLVCAMLCSEPRRRPTTDALMDYVIALQKRFSSSSGATEHVNAKDVLSTFVATDQGEGSSRSNSEKVGDEGGFQFLRQALEKQEREAEAQRRQAAAEPSRQLIKDAVPADYVADQPSSRKEPAQAERRRGKAKGGSGGRANALSETPHEKVRKDAAKGQRGRRPLSARSEDFLLRWLLVTLLVLSGMVYLGELSMTRSIEALDGGQCVSLRPDELVGERSIDKLVWATRGLSVDAIPCDDPGSRTRVISVTTDEDAVPHCPNGRCWTRTVSGFLDFHLILELVEEPHVGLCYFGLVDDGGDLYLDRVSYGECDRFPEWLDSSMEIFSDQENLNPGSMTKTVFRIESMQSGDEPVCNPEEWTWSPSYPTEAELALCLAAFPDGQGL